MPLYRWNPAICKATISATNPQDGAVLLGSRLGPNSLQIAGWEIHDWRNLLQRSCSSFGLTSSLFWQDHFQHNGEVQPFGPMPDDDFKLTVVYACQGVGKPKPAERAEDAADAKAFAAVRDHPIARLMGHHMHRQPMLFLAVPPSSIFNGGGFAVSFYDNTPPTSLRVAIALAKNVPAEARIWWNPFHLTADWRHPRAAEEAMESERAAKLSLQTA